MSSGTGSQAIGSNAMAPFPPMYPSTCTFVKQKDSNLNGCYLYRSCQSCLETDGCVVNDYGICVSADQGLFNLQSGFYQSSTNYYPPMNYLNAINQSLALPTALSTNPNANNALVTEQNWHFRAGEATYCSTSDRVCQECKTQNFYRTTGAAPDSRFCVGQSGCVCIQTCEAPTYYKPPGCQWKLSSPYSNSYYNGGDDYNYSVRPTERLEWWGWLIIVVLIVVVNVLLRRCFRTSEHDLKLAREEAVRAVRRELGIPQEEPVATYPVAMFSAMPRPPPRRTQTELTDDMSDDEASYEIETPRADDTVVSSHSVFVEVVDTTSSTAQQEHSDSGNRV